MLMKKYTMTYLHFSNIFYTITYLYFSNILFMEYNAKNMCKTATIGKEQNLNKQMAEFAISILYLHFGQIQYFFNVLKTDFTIQYFQYHVETLAQDWYAYLLYLDTALEVNSLLKHSDMQLFRNRVQFSSWFNRPDEKMLKMSVKIATSDYWRVKQFHNKDKRLHERKWQNTSVTESVPYWSIGLTSNLH